jgi:glycosyltransferase involved in cell wall biosynthesis
VPLYYRLAEVVVDPVIDNEVGRTRLPLKLFESWASQTPFVTADVGDRKLVMGEPAAGLLAAPGDADSLAGAILQVLTTPGLAEELRQAGSKRALEYDWDRLAQRLESVYNNYRSNSAQEDKAACTPSG